jgi:broad specificity phosphatase PhoE
MPAELILVKHAMPRIEPARPSRSWTLSDEGRTAAGRLAERLVRLGPVALAASDEPKAVETASIIGDVLGLKPAVDPDLGETRRETVPFQSQETFEAGIARFFAEPDALVFGEETADAAHARFSGALERRAGFSPQVVVAHGTVISVYVSRRAGIEPMTLWRSLGLAHALVLGADGRIVDRLTAE